MNLVSLGDIADILNVSRQRADQLARQTGFPKPHSSEPHPKGGKIWKRSEVERWQRKRST